MRTKSFAGKFLSRLEKIDRRQIESYLSNLVQEREFLDVIFNRMEEGIIVTDANRRILFMNAAACKNLSLKGDPAQYAGKILTDLIASSHLRERITNFDMNKDQDIAEEIKVNKPRGHILKIRFLPIQDDSGDINSIVFLISDITEQKLKEFTLMQQQRICALANLTAGVAHEIKNPLNSLQIHAQLLKKFLSTQKKNTDPEQKERNQKSIDIILEEISRLSEIVNQFLMAVRPQKIAFHPGDINHILKRLAETISPILEQKGVRLIMNLEPTKVEILSNEERLYQAFWNIAQNAQEAMENTENPILKITTRIESQKLAIDFNDNGCGIAEEHFENIFDPYFTTKFSGSGRGLMLVYQIVNEHGGQIDIKSAKGKGTQVTITLPLSRRLVRFLTERTDEDEKKNTDR
ncbi:PAS domain-containing protein [Candidatus Sumerlaeota bacterium]|nr:PAS domain-containing protein [Candidatus Sumerlaeota bacterium]